MLITAPIARLALLVWALTWLPGLALTAWRVERLLRARRRLRALAEALAWVLVPMSAFALYALPDAQRYAQAHGSAGSVGSLVSALQVAGPYAVSMAYLWAVLRPGVQAPERTRWRLATLLGLVAVPVLTPGLLMAQLMVLAGG